MPAIKRKVMRTDNFLLPVMKLLRFAQNTQKLSRRTFLFSLFLALLLACSFGCAPSASPGNGQPNPSASSDKPELTDEMIREEINDAYVRQVPEENGASEPISWRFDNVEPKQMTVVEKQIEGDRATIVIDIQTGTAPNARSPKRLAGRISTKWKLQTGWALRTWQIVETENISLKYKNLPKPPADNSNR